MSAEVWAEPEEGKALGPACPWFGHHGCQPCQSDGWWMLQGKKDARESLLRSSLPWGDCPTSQDLRAVRGAGEGIGTRFPHIPALPHVKSLSCVSARAHVPLAVCSSDGQQPERYISSL